MTGIWNDINPKQTSAKDENCQWTFGSYIETPSDRDDDHWYVLFTFRNLQRTVFGKIENLSEEPQFLDCRVIATKTIKNKKYRDSLISDDPDLPKIWKRR